MHGTAEAWVLAWPAAVCPGPSSLSSLNLVALAPRLIAVIPAHRGVQALRE